jgi:aldose sugar dehydrogenase
LNGKVIRIHSDGSIPRDNPFLNTPGALPEIFSMGHRNPQGLDIHPLTGNPVVSEHGPTGYDANLPGHGPVGKADEVNWLVSGGNYGWPLIFGDPRVLPWTREMSNLVSSGKMLMPLKEFSVPDGIAPSGSSFYKGNMFPKWKNDFFVTALRGYLVRLKMNSSGMLLEEEKIVPSGFGRFRDVASGKQGELWAITDSGELVRIDRNGSSAPPVEEPRESSLFPTALEALKRNACLECHGFLRQESTIPSLWKGPNQASSAIWRSLITNRMPLNRPAMSSEDKSIIASWLKGLEGN